ncbi:MAG: hypothetical protein JO235_05845 [Chroococcidiopsidaceae cyanobacterium CP_BM_RX_35]|nr:hypothetical protein [Chroococcidiopsidaceae cyanobacterium CP_BM_RX_35]
MNSTAIPTPISEPAISTTSVIEPPSNKTTRKKRSSKTMAEVVASTATEPTPELAPTPKKRQSRSKATSAHSEEIAPSPTAELQVFETTGEKTQPVASEASAVQKKSAQRVG